MSGAAIDPRTAGPRTPPRRGMSLSWSDPRLRNVVWQVVILGTVAALVWYLVSNTNRNLEARRIATGFAFLARTAGIPIGEHLVEYDPATGTYGRALLVGVLNTLRVAIIGVVLATVLGTVVGVARLSHNWLIARLAAIYVEVLRDVPLLLQLLFWYGLLRLLPDARQAFNPVGGVYLSNRGLTVPVLDWQPAHGWAAAAFLAGSAATLLWSRAAARRQEATGVRPPVWPVALGAMVALPALVWAAFGAPFALEMPRLGGSRFFPRLEGGATLSPEFTALLIGLVTYTAAFIAEIVRSGIQAVPQGQWEAGGALGLRRGTVLRRIVLPQALRVIIPPMTSQYLNLTKNSSLAVAIGYPDLVSIANTTLNQTGQSIEGVGLMMLAFLTISLSISLFMNWYNAKIALVER